MKIVKLAMYTVIGGVLSTAGVHATKDWQFAVVLICVVAIDVLSAISQPKV